MNGVYPLSPTPKAPHPRLPASFSLYPRGAHSFDVYSPPIRSLYSQVFWKGLPPVPLPPEVVERYRGKGMAVLGFEVDQVRRTPQGDVSVPINVAYSEFPRRTPLDDTTLPPPVTVHV